MGEHSKGGRSKGPGGGYGKSGGAHTGKGGSHASKGNGCAVWGIALLGAAGAGAWAVVEAAGRALS